MTFVLRKEKKIDVVEIKREKWGRIAGGEESKL